MAFIGSRLAVGVVIAGWMASGPLLHGGGVTLITHGFNGNVTDWVIPMGTAMVGHPSFDGSDVTCYEIELLSGPNSTLIVNSFRIGGPPGDEVGSGEIVVKLDWSDVSTNLVFSSTDVATEAANALRNANLLPELDGRALAELPIHLIGHSRGGSVVTEISRLLGERGVWVDQVTALDPVPVGLYGDAAVRSWENVLFAESYWQDIGGFLVPTGQPIVGAYNRQLTNLSGGGSSPHSDAHLWYHGTIDLQTPATDTQDTITSSERNAWWTPAEGQGSTAGFHYSRIGGGDRTSSLQPTGSSAIRDGLNQLWDFGAGISSNRQLLSSKSDVWPNIIVAGNGGPSSLMVGEDLDLSISYQDGASAVDPVLTVSLDPDRNPWNGNETSLLTTPIPAAGAFNVLEAAGAISTVAAAPGSYAVMMSLSQGGKVRHFHLREGVELTAAPIPLMIVEGSAGFVDGKFGFEVSGQPGSEVTVEVSDDLIQWDPLETQVLGTGSWAFSDPTSSTEGRRFYRVVD